MKREHILAIDAQAFDNVPRNVLYSPEHFEVDPQHVIIAHREQLDNKVNEDGTKGVDSFRQAIGYLVLLNSSHTHYLGYRRKGNEERLNGKVSIGFGGHTTVADLVCYGDEIDVGASVQRAALRELSEELQVRAIVPEGQTENLFEPFDYNKHVMGETVNTPMIVCDRTEVDKLHVGFSTTLVLEAGLEFQLGDHGSELLWIPCNELSDGKDSGLAYEEWSRIVLEAE